MFLKCSRVTNVARPRQVRNFWLLAASPSQARPLAFGPRPGRDGSFELDIYQRAGGKLALALRITGRPSLGRTQLVLEVQGADGTVACRYEAVP